MDVNLPSGIIDAQNRLIRLGYDIPEEENSTLGPETLRAITSYQEIHGLEVTGTLDSTTYEDLTALVYELGDRLLFERQPPFKGDDVTELQHRLNSLGFNAGREDGFFQTETAQALREFQRNMGISSDGICGPNTLTSLERVSTFASSSATNLREEINWQSREVSMQYRLGILIDPNFTLIGDQLIKELFTFGVVVPFYREETKNTFDASDVNSANIDFLISITPSFSATPRSIFFSNTRYRSHVGALLAGSIQHKLANVMKSDPDEISGRMYPILRESKMPCVVIELCDTSDISMVKYINDHSIDIANSIAGGILDVTKHVSKR